MTIQLQSRSKPSAGKTMVGLLKEFGAAIHYANSLLAIDLASRIPQKRIERWKDETILFRFFQGDVQLLERNKIQLLSASLLSNLLCAVSLKQLPINASLLDGEKWFSSKAEDACLSNYISQESLEAISNSLRELLPRITVEMLPYLFEIFETGQEASKETGIHRIKKKQAGIYYTPSDIIDFVIGRSSQERTKEIENLSWYDPAVGTGAFLIGVMAAISNKDVLETFVKTKLFGTDISPFALQSTLYLIVANFLKSNPKFIVPINAARAIGSNFALYDATKITVKIVQKIFPTLNTPGFDFIISNPPYSKRKNNVQLNFFSGEGNRGEADEIYPDFVRMIFDLSNPNGSGGMVLPLSIVSNSKTRFQALRQYIQSKAGKVEFWNFDRTPDSLFGDDVKTRNTILFYNSSSGRNGSESHSSYLHRWNSRSRASLFESISLSRLPDSLDLSKGVPKIGDAMGINLLMSLNSVKGSLREVIVPSRSKSMIAIKSTAYNWIPVELVTTETSEVGKSFWNVRNPDISAEMVYAVLNSRLTYWIWRVWGDGFHLSNQQVFQLPFGTKFFEQSEGRMLHQLGAMLWGKVQSQKSIVRNAGRESHTYCPLAFDELITSIDEAVLGVIGVGNDYVDFLRKYINRTIYAGREGEYTISRKIKYLELI